MHRIALVLVAVCLAVVVFGGVASRVRASNIDIGNVAPCLNGGWKQVVRANGTPFSSQFACVQYAAFGGVPGRPCTAGSENFAEDAEFSAPTTFAGGTIDTAYGGGGGIRIVPNSWGGGFAAGTHLLFSGDGENSFTLTFTKSVGSVQLEGMSNIFGPTNDTLTANDASNAVIGSDTHFEPGGSTDIFNVNSTTNNIKSFAFSTDDINTFGVGFSNIVWGCAS